MRKKPTHRSLRTGGLLVPDRELASRSIMPHDWATLPPELVVKIARHLDLVHVPQFVSVCRAWHAAVIDHNLFWRTMLQSAYPQECIPGDCRHATDVNWQTELIRLRTQVPSVHVQTLSRHTDEVVFVTFAHEYADFVSCSKDSSFVVWRYDKDIHEFKKFDDHAMDYFDWRHTWGAQFSPDDRKLLISGVVNSLNGEIIIYDTHLGEDDTSPYSFVCRVINDPYDAMGSWCTSRYFVSGFYRFSEQFPPTMDVTLFLCDFQPTEPEDLWNIQPETANELLSLDNYVVRLLDFENDMSLQYLRFVRIYSRKNHRLDAPESYSHPRAFLIHDGEQELTDECRSILEDNKLSLVVIYGDRTFIPHKVGFRDFTVENITKPQRLVDFAHSIDMNGQIISLSCSSDDQYLYVAVRAWPENAIPSSETPPPISSEVIVHVINLETKQLTGKTFRGPIGRTDSEDAFYLYTDSSPNFLACGSEDGKGAIWDRKLGFRLASLNHEACVNCVSFMKTNEEICVSSSDDNTIKVWKSRRRLATEKSTLVFE
eukprot:maker-scaffold735_size104922-snap-gene-0.32 protein:Tk08161 transcript:maker-scaffold735_size104922-snap-gene-0.32-mRNA-1 annotation:"f-box and wd domain"